MKRTILLMLLSYCFFWTSKAQDSTRHFQWLNAGFGITGGAILNSFTSLNGAINYYYKFGDQVKGNTLQFGFSVSQEVFVTPNLFAISIGYGKTYHSRWVSVGTYLAPSIDLGKSNSDTFITPGINTCIAAVFLPIYNVGLGLELFGQFNLVQSPIGIRAVLHFNNQNHT